MNKNVIKAYVIQPFLYEQNVDYDYYLEEGINLTKSLDLVVLGSSINKIRTINAATFLTSGFIDSIKAYISDLLIEVIVVNYSISPIQQRNLEKIWGIKVIDRNGLIINIFSKRARSKEGKLQAELASLIYQKSRLVKAWSHLERQRGGGGFTAGPGETQKEIDKRLIADKVDVLKKQILKVQQNRDTQSSKRTKQEYKIIALVGYTNAGKSTLFNQLTNSDVFAEDLLFATLDPTMRILNIGKQKFILLDTVGFVSNLPHQLITAFQSTLIEVKQADIILHVIDANSLHFESQTNSVKNVLKELNITEDMYKSKVIEVYNKSDIMTPDKLNYFNSIFINDNRKILFSARKPDNINDLKNLILNEAFKDYLSFEVIFSIENHNLLLFLYNNSVVINKTVQKNNYICIIKISNNNYIKFKEIYSNMYSISKE